MRRSILVATLLVAACGGLEHAVDGGVGGGGGGTAVTGDGGVSVADAGNAATHEVAGDERWSSSDVVDLTLSGASLTVSANGADRVTIDGSVATISAAGTYRLTSTLDDGQLVVDAPDGVVKLVLAGAQLTATSSNAPLFIKDAERTVIILADGTSNSLTDDSSYVLEAGEDEPNGTLFSKDDLSIYGDGAGTGTLTVHANYEDGIVSKDGLVIVNARIDVTAVDDGVRGKDYLVVRDSQLTVTAGGDGLKSTNEDDESLGFVTLSGGAFTLVAAGDGVDAQTRLTITSGSFDITTGGGSAATLATDASAKGLKGVAAVRVSGGTFDIDSADDAVHSNDLIQIDAGVFQVATGDDAFHADLLLLIRGGTIDISTCYEGLESAYITYEGGTTTLVSSDDGVNVAGELDGSDSPPGSVSTSPYLFTMSGGAIYASSSGDGVDVNGSVVMTGGLIVVDGPSANDNGALDYDGTFLISGGTVLAVESKGMAVAPSAASAQRSFMVTYGAAGGGPGGGTSATMPAGTLVHAELGGGELFTFRPSKPWQSVVFSSPALTAGASVTFFTGGASSGGAETGGYIEGGAYSGGTLRTTFTLTSTVTNASFQ